MFLGISLLFLEPCLCVEHHEFIVSLTMASYIGPVYWYVICRLVGVLRCLDRLECLQVIYQSNLDVEIGTGRNEV